MQVMQVFAKWKRGGNAKVIELTGSNLRCVYMPDNGGVTAPISAPSSRRLQRCSICAGLLENALLKIQLPWNASRKEFSSVCTILA